MINLMKNSNDIKTLTISTFLSEMRHAGILLKGVDKR
jgi:hypothetical protein